MGQLGLLSKIMRGRVDHNNNNLNIVEDLNRWPKQRLEVLPFWVSQNSVNKFVYYILFSESNYRVMVWTNLDTYRGVCVLSILLRIWANKSLTNLLNLVVVFLFIQTCVQLTMNSHFE